MKDDIQVRRFMGWEEICFLVLRKGSSMRGFGFSRLLILKGGFGSGIYM
jgi:hypothetical protein